MFLTIYYSDPSKDKDVEKVLEAAGGKSRGFVITPSFRSLQADMPDAKVTDGFRAALKLKGYSLERPRG